MPDGSTGLQKERRRNSTYAITEEQLAGLAFRAAERVARIHRLRLVASVFLATLGVSCVVAFLVGSAVAHDAKTRSKETCAVLKDVTTVMTQFVTSDAKLRTASGALYDTKRIKASLLRLAGTPDLGPALVAQAKLSSQYASYWATLVPKLRADAKQNCTAIG